MTAVLLPLMVEDMPDTAERMRLAVYEIPFALPEKKREEADTPPPGWRNVDVDEWCSLFGEPD